jgi:hypothetical protein
MCVYLVLRLPAHTLDEVCLVLLLGLLLLALLPELLLHAALRPREDSALRLQLVALALL